MSWQRVTSDELETRTGIVVEVEVDGSVNIRTDGGTWQLRPAGDDLKVLLDVRKGEMHVLPLSSNSVRLHMKRRP